jgi:hypothetical protein
MLLLKIAAVLESIAVLDIPGEREPGEKRPERLDSW